MLLSRHIYEDEVVNFVTELGFLRGSRRLTRGYHLGLRPSLLPRPSAMLAVVVELTIYVGRRRAGMALLLASSLAHFQSAIVLRQRAGCLAQMARRSHLRFLGIVIHCCVPFFL